MPSAEPPDVGGARKLIGEDRDRYASYVHQLYVTDKMSVRQIARHTGRSFGLIHRLLHEVDTKMRPEGHQLGVPMHAQRAGTKEVIEVLEKKRNGKWGPVA